MLNLDRQNQWREYHRARHPHWQPATEQYASLVRRSLPAEGLILDLGCGRGGLIEQLNLPLNRFIGLDPDWLSLAEHRLPLPRAVGWSHALPFAPHSFQLIFASWVLEHLATPQQDLTNISRILAPGGQFIFITPNKAHPLLRFNQIVSRLGAWQTHLIDTLYGRQATDTFPAYYRANSPTQLHTLAQQTGLHLTHLDYIPDPTYLAFNAPLYHLSATFERALPTHYHIHLVGVLTKPT
ncbi:MAG TPA: methyltransferase domain-containing protein [Anaerolineae bacterium]|nr:methyltransferase domain-containing protein [Anaerolineae bacterium]